MAFYMVLAEKTESDYLRAVFLKARFLGYSCGLVFFLMYFLGLTCFSILSLEIMGRATPYLLFYKIK